MIGDWRRLVHEGVPEGERYSTITSLAGRLLRRDVDGRVVPELLLAWNCMRCRLPLEDAEGSQVFSNIAKLQSADAEDGL